LTIVTSVVLSVVGLVGTLRLQTCLMLVHSFFCCSGLGAFYVFLLLDVFLRNEQHGELSESVGDRTILFLLSLPFLVIFLIGCHSMYLLSMVLDEVRARKKEQGEMQQLTEIRAISVVNEREEVGHEGSALDEF